MLFFLPKQNSQKDDSNVEGSNGNVGPHLHQDELHPEHVDHQVGWVLGSGNAECSMRIEEDIQSYLPEGCRDQNPSGQGGRGGKCTWGGNTLVAYFKRGMYEY